MSNTTMNISLPETLREYVEERVAEGSFANASDFVRALIRDDRAKRAQASLEAMLLEGLESGPAVVADDAYWETSRPGSATEPRNASACDEGPAHCS